MGICSEGYKKATEGRNWKTAGDDVQYEVKVSETKEMTWVYVFYQCSQSKRDWQHNLDFIPIRVKIAEDMKIWVFRGLWKAFISAWSTVYQEILNALPKEEPYVVTFAGHSFGGAMSVYSALMWSRLQRKNKPHHCAPMLFTWGAPKVILSRKANKEFSYMARGTQFACHNDLIARMPPFFAKYTQTKFVGEKFNLFKMLFKAEYYHTCYDELED